nr:MAG TPA: hypothetical protein [Caudoviricetes sp.]
MLLLHIRAPAEIIQRHVKVIGQGDKNGKCWLAFSLLISVVAHYG